MYILARKGKRRQIVCPDGEKSGAMYLSIPCATYLHLPELGFSLLKSEIYNLPIQSEAFLPRPRQAYNLPIFSHALADIQSARFAPLVARTYGPPCSPGTSDPSAPPFRHRGITRRRVLPPIGDLVRFPYNLCQIHDPSFFFSPPFLCCNAPDGGII